MERFASVKKKSASRLINMHRNAGLRIDGVGMQAHTYAVYADNRPTAENSRGDDEGVHASGSGTRWRLRSWM
ncbi:hypothetical protein QR685DRAFT_82026 [Neurospora intermedia]|uniref:GH10 domain-containing protein n=1 Tax=Neurospora intermedia TaxID=5142 RepID=A0ABR3D3M2_NEUIN